MLNDCISNEIRCFNLVQKNENIMADAIVIFNYTDITY